MKQYPSRMGVGASSILLILVVVSLTLFAALSLMQARADAALTQKTAESIATFYDADARAQEKLAALDDALQQGASPESIDGVTRQADGTLSFSIQTQDGHALNVRIDPSGGRCNILAYQYENTQDWAGENAGTLWQGG